ncbi:site-specific integrase, partial [candidate division KSB1 bacterium]|nr:site-specific integrase [candidate division KSB1 bacterium]
IENVIDPYIELTETKNNKKRLIPLNDDMIELLTSLPKSEDGYVFQSMHGQRLSDTKHAWKNTMIRAGIVDFKFHDLRHTFASHFVMKGGDLLTLKEILGHSTMKMVERYAHLAAAHKRRQINLLNGTFTTPRLSATSVKLAVNSDTKSNLN